MKYEVASRKRATNISLPEALVAEARALGVNLSQACAKGLAADVKKAREEKWIAENWDAIQSSNAWVEEHGLPLAKYRMF